MSDTLGSDDKGNATVCKLCLKSEARYTCPRCGLAYCSISCYKCAAHLQCSEAFYKKCVVSHLQNMESDESDKKKMMAMLQRLHEEDQGGDSNDEEDDDLAERLASVDLDGNTDKVWQSLTDVEKVEFQAMLVDGRLGSLVELWLPWWSVQDSLLIEEVTEPDAAVSKVDCCPSILTDIADLSVLLQNKVPSGSLRYNILNVLYGYVYLARLHNGDHLEIAVQCSEDVLQLCGALSDHSYSSASQALHSCLEWLKTKDSALFVSEQFSVNAIADLTTLLVGRQGAPLQFVLAALSDLHNVFRQARKIVKKDERVSQPSNGPGITSKRLYNQPSDGPGITSKRLYNQPSDGPGITSKRLYNQPSDGPGITSKRLYAAQKKLQFFISWTNKYGRSIRELIPELELEFCELSTAIANQRKFQDDLEQKWGGKKPPLTRKIIEEI